VSACTFMGNFGAANVTPTPKDKPITTMLARPSSNLPDWISARIRPTKLDDSEILDKGSLGRNPTVSLGHTTYSSGIQSGVREHIVRGT
jgi:hypothetical protein